MCKKRAPLALLGIALAVVGIIIVTYILLPRAFWWFLAGVALIVLGLRLMKRR